LGLASVVFGAVGQCHRRRGVKFTLPITQLVVFVILAGLAGLLAGCGRRAAGRA
jgi:hypothetical protein